MFFKYMYVVYTVYTEENSCLTELFDLVYAVYMFNVLNFILSDPKACYAYVIFITIINKAYSRIVGSHAHTHTLPHLYLYF